MIGRQRRWTTSPSTAAVSWAQACASTPAVALHVRSTSPASSLTGFQKSGLVASGLATVNVSGSVIGPPDPIPQQCARTPFSTELEAGLVACSRKHRVDRVQRSVTASGALRRRRCSHWRLERTIGGNASVGDDTDVAMLAVQTHQRDDQRQRDHAAPRSSNGIFVNRTAANVPSSRTIVDGASRCRPPRPDVFGTLPLVRDHRYLVVQHGSWLVTDCSTREPTPAAVHHHQRQPAEWQGRVVLLGDPRGDVRGRSPIITWSIAGGRCRLD